MILDNHSLAKLAREVAMNIKNRDELLAAYGLTQEDYEQIERIPFFRRALDTLIIEWNKPLTTEERIRLISMTYVEETLPAVGGRVNSGSEPLASSVEAVKMLAGLAGLNVKDGKPAASLTDRFVITINMGADKLHFDKPIAIEEPQKAFDLKTLSAPEK